MRTKRLLALIWVLQVCMWASAYYPSDRIVILGKGFVYPSAIMGIAHDDGHLYVAKLDGLEVIDKATGDKTFYGNEDRLFGYTPTSLTCRGGVVWIGTREGKLLWLSNGVVSAVDYDFTQSITNLVFDSLGYLYLSCGLGEGYVVDVIDRTVVKQFSIDIPVGGYATSMVFDKNETLWVGKEKGQPKYYSLARYTAFEGTVFPFRENVQLPCGNIYSLAVDSDNGLWYSTYLISGSKYLLVRLSDGEMSASYQITGSCYGMAFDSQQRLWMALRVGELLMMKDGEFTTYHCDIESENWTCMHMDGDVIYIGTDEKLLKFKDGVFSIADFGQHVPTGVDVAEQTAAADRQPAFDLQGRPVSIGQRGIVVSSGRKYLKLR